MNKEQTRTYLHSTFIFYLYVSSCPLEYKIHRLYQLLFNFDLFLFTKKKITRFQHKVKPSILSGSQYYRYRNKTLEEGFPKRISQGFSGIPAYLAAAVVYNEKIYFIKKSRYYIFTPSESPPVKGSFIAILVFSSLDNHNNCVCGG